MGKKVKRILSLIIILIFTAGTLIVPAPGMALTGEYLNILYQDGSPVSNPITVYSQSVSDSNKSYSAIGSPVELVNFESQWDNLIISEEDSGDATVHRMWVVPTDTMESETVGESVFYSVYRPEANTANYLNTEFNAPNGTGQFILDLYLNNYYNSFSLYPYEVNSGDVISVGKGTDDWSGYFGRIYSVDYIGQDQTGDWNIEFDVWRSMYETSSDMSIGGMPEFEDIEVFSAPADFMPMSVSEGAGTDAVKAKTQETGSESADEYYFIPDRYVYIDFDLCDQYGNEIYSISKNDADVTPGMEIFAADGTSLGQVPYDTFYESFIWEMPEGAEGPYTAIISQDTGPYAGVVSREITLIPDDQVPEITVETSADDTGNIIINGTVTDNGILDFVHTAVDDTTAYLWIRDGMDDRFVDPNLEILEETVYADNTRVDFSVRLNNPAAGSHKIEVVASDSADNETIGTGWFDVYSEGSPQVISVSPENGAVLTDTGIPLEAMVNLPQENITSAEFTVTGGPSYGTYLPEIIAGENDTTVLRVYPRTTWAYPYSEQFVSAELHLVPATGSELYYTWEFTIDTEAPDMWLWSVGITGEDSNPFGVVGAGTAELIISSDEELDLSKSELYILPGSEDLFMPDAVTPRLIPPDVSEILEDAEECTMEFFAQSYGEYLYKTSYNIDAETPNGLATVFCSVYDLLGNNEIETEEFWIDTMSPELTNAVLVPLGGLIGDKARSVVQPRGVPGPMPLPDETYANNETPLGLIAEYKCFDATDTPVISGTADFSQLSGDYSEPVEIADISMLKSLADSDVQVRESAYIYEYVFYPNLKEQDYIYSDLPSYEDGARTFTVELSDMAGNTGSIEGTIIIDNTPPKMDLTVEPGDLGKLNLSVQVSEELFDPESDIIPLIDIPAMPWIYAGPLEAEEETEYIDVVTFMGARYGLLQADWTADGNTYTAVADDTGKPQIAAVVMDKAQNIGMAAYCTYYFMAAEGIDIILPDGTSISIPPGAVTAPDMQTQGLAWDSMITIKAFLPEEGSLADYYLAGGSVDIRINGQEHYEFNEPVTITIPEQGTGLEGKAKLACYDEVSGEWELLETERTTNEDGNFLTANVNHFSRFAALADVTAPQITVTAPADNSTTSSSGVTITGITEPGLRVTAACGSASESVTAGTDGSFQVTVSLQLGANTVTVSAADWAGNTGQETLTLTRRTSSSSSGSSVVVNDEEVTEEIEEQLGSGDDDKVVVEASGNSVVMTSEVLNRTSGEGKSLVVRSGDVEFAIPPQALNIDEIQQADEGSKIRINVQESTEDVNENGLKGTGKVYEFTIEVVNNDAAGNEVSSFQKTVKVKIKYQAGNDVDETKLGVYRLNEETGEWEYIGGRINKSDKTIEVGLEHFSKYAVLEYKKTFADISDHWAKDAVELMAARHIAKGMPDGSFAPEETVTRAQFAAMLVRTLGLAAEGPPAGSFSDVSSSSWYYGAVEAASKAGLIKGTGNGSFDPDREITRREMAVMASRALEMAGIQTGTNDTEINSELSGFADSEGLPQWAREGFAISLKNGIIHGRSSSLAPNEEATRAESIVIMKNFLEAAGEIQ